MQQVCYRSVIYLAYWKTHLIRNTHTQLKEYRHYLTSKGHHGCKLLYKLWSMGMSAHCRLFNMCYVFIHRRQRYTALSHIHPTVSTILGCPILYLRQLVQPHLPISCSTISPKQCAWAHKHTNKHNSRKNTFVLYSAFVKLAPEAQMGLRSHTTGRGPTVALPWLFLDLFRPLVHFGVLSTHGRSQAQAFPHAPWKNNHILGMALPWLFRGGSKSLSLHTKSTTHKNPKSHTEAISYNFLRSCL